MSQTRSAEHGILGEDPLTTDPQRSQPSGLVPAACVGRSAPLGATVACGGVNFSLYSRDASGIELLFFDQEDDGRPSHVIRLDQATNRTYHYWHVFVPGLQAGQLYGYRFTGHSIPPKGCVLIRRRSCSTRMVAESPFLETTPVKRRDKKATMPPPQ